MYLDHVKFLSGWVTLENGSVAMDGRKSTLEIENTGGDFLIIEYAYPGREEESGISVSIKVFEEPIGTFRGFYSSPFYIGFKIPAFSQKKLLVTLETDHSYFRTDSQGEKKESGITLHHLELLKKEADPSKYLTFEKKVENLRDHFSRLLNPSREAQSLPIAMLIEPTSRCNMDCVMCARSIPGHSREEERDFPDEYMPMLARSMVGIQAARIQGLGEPLISRSFVPLISHLESNRVHILTFNTNGYLMDEAMARFLVDKGKVFEDFRLSFSLDAATPEVYYKIRGKDWNRTLKNIRYLLAYQKELGYRSPRVTINIAMSRTNIGDLEKFIQLAHDLGVQAELNNLDVAASYNAIHIRRGQYVFDYEKELVTTYPKLYNRHLKRAENLGKKLNVTIHRWGDVTYQKVPPSRFNLFSLLGNSLRGIFKSHPKPSPLQEIPKTSHPKDPSYENLPLCLLPWSQLVINVKGDASLCCVQGPIDHLKNYTSIEEIWNSERMCNIRESLIHRKFPPECQLENCTVKRWNTRVCMIHQ